MARPPTQTGNAEEPATPRSMEKPYYSAQVFPDPWIADHHPLQLQPSGVPLVEGTKRKVLKINDLTVEDWQAKDIQFLEFWNSNHLRVRNSTQLKNPTRLLDIIYQGLRLIFADQMRAPKKKRNKSKEQPAPTSPFQIFCKRNLSHPDYPALIRAVQQADAPLTTQIMDRMSLDGWRDYLASTHPSNTSAFFRFLAKEDGRQFRQKLYSCMAPLKDSQGIRHFTMPQKCELMADHLQNKLASKQNEPHQPQAAEEHGKLPSGGGG